MTFQFKKKAFVEGKKIYQQQQQEALNEKKAISQVFSKRNKRDFCLAIVFSSNRKQVFFLTLSS